MLSQVARSAKKTMSLQSRKVLLGTGVVILLVLGVLVYRAYLNPIADDTLRSSGIVEAPEVNLASTVAGRIVFVCCKEGEAVKPRQVVIRLDSADLTAAVEQAQAASERADTNVQVSESSVNTAKLNIVSAKAAIQSAQADLDKAQAEVKQVKQQLERSRALQKQQFISQQDLDTVITAYDTVVANQTSAKSRLTASQANKLVVTSQLDTAKKQLQAVRAAAAEARAALEYNQAKLRDTEIVSPIAGVVVFKALEVGETVNPGQTILTIDDLSHRYARVDIDETRVDGIVLGSEATLTTEGSPQVPINGRVAEIGRYAEFATQTNVKGGRQDIRTFRIKITVDDPEGILKPGMTVEVSIPKRTGP